MAEFYTNKKFPGVGVSIGLSRLFYKLNELNLIKAEKKSISSVIVIPMTEDISKCIEIATTLRNNGINTEIYLNDKKIKTKIKYADRLNIPYIILMGDDEIAANKITLKNMNIGEQKLVTIEEAILEIKNIEK